MQFTHTLFHHACTHTHSNAPADEHAPAAVKSVWIAIFLMAIPVGYALGYIYGGIVGSLLGWRLAFLLEALLMAPFVALGFLSKPIPFTHKAAQREVSRARIMRVGSGSPESVPEHESLLMPDPEEATSITSGHAESENGRGRPQRSAADAEQPHGAGELLLQAKAATVLADAGTVLKCALVASRQRC